MYRIARRSAKECVGAADLLDARELLSSDQLQACHALPDRILAMLAMLTKLVDRYSDPEP